MELQELFDKVSQMDITLVAGAAGMHGQVTWVHMYESIEAGSFLNGGEVTFLTGVGLSSVDDLLPLVRHLGAHHCAGVVVNTGPYIETIPDTVIAYCDEHGLPLFCVPWRVHLSEIMRIWTTALTREPTEAPGSYRELALYRLLQSIPDQALIDDYLEHTVRPLLVHDAQNKTNLVDVLRTYLSHNGSVQETAAALYVHRNTINYRLSCIKELTGVDISDLQGRVQLVTALMLLDMQA